MLPCTPQLLVSPANRASASTPFSITAIGTNGSTAATASYTFTSQAIGTADATRLVVVGIGSGINAVTVSSVTIGGSAATQATSAQASTAGGSFTDVWYLAVPTGTTATIVVNYTGAQSRCAISVYSVVGTGAAFSTASTGTTAGALTTSATATVPAGGGAIGFIVIHSAGDTATGTNLTIDQGGTVNGSSVMAAGHNTTASGSTSFTFSWTPNATDAAMSVVTFNP